MFFDSINASIEQYLYFLVIIYKSRINRLIDNPELDLDVR